MSVWRWFGHACHLIVGTDCRFHMATVVNDKWLISTVGEWLPDSRTWDIDAEFAGVTLEGRGDALRADYMRKIGWKEIGMGRTYETMVFPVESGKSQECGCPIVTAWGELDSDGYNDAGDATRGHYEMCERWADKDAA